METANDDTLARAVRGDRAALANLLRRHGPTVRRSLTGRIPERWQSVLSEDDVMQQSYADAVRSISSFNSRDESSFAKWLATTAENNLRDAIKELNREKRGGERRRVELVRSDETYLDLLNLLSSSGTTPSGHFAREEAKTALERAIEQLPELYARVVVMYDLECRSSREVADALERSSGAVFMLRARAQDRLREILGRTSKFFTS